MFFLRIAEKKPEVIERWLRKRFGKRLERVARFAIRIKHSILYFRTDRQRRKVLDEAMKATETAIHRCERNGYVHTLKVLQCNLFMLVPLKDIETVKMRAALSDDEWERKLSLRIIILTTFEWGKNTSFDKSFYASLAKISVSKPTVDRLKREVREFHKQHEKFTKKYANARNKLIAHRHSNAREFITRIRNLPDQEIFTDASALTEKVSPLIETLTEIVRPEQPPYH
ncbi:MAG: hypothetical protein ACK4RN_12395 [Pseudorhodobacter sp.]